MPCCNGNELWTSPRVLLVELSTLRRLGRELSLVFAVQWATMGCFECFAMLASTDHTVFSPRPFTHVVDGSFFILVQNRQTVMLKSCRQVEARCLLYAAQAFKHSPAWNEVVGRRRSLNEWRHIARSSLAVCPCGLCFLGESSRRLHC